MLPGKSLLKVSALAASLTFCISTNAQAADEYIVELFSTYCTSCHTAPQSGAPQAFDHAVWQKRLENKGMNGLVDSAVAGFKNMPPVGGCGECTAEDLEDLILYMSQNKQDARS